MLAGGGGVVEAEGVGDDGGRDLQDELAQRGDAGGAQRQAVRVHRDPGLPPPPGDDLVDAAGGQRLSVVPAGAKGRVGCKAFDQMAGELKA